MIQLDNVSYSYDKGGGVSNVNLNLNDSEYAFLIGPTGSGKTTLLRLIYMELFPQVGKVVVDKYNSKNIVISTGSIPTSLPGIKIDEKIIVSSTGALSFSKVPKKLIIIGGGYIGLEMGSVWKRLGSNVTVVEFLDHIIPGMDKDISTEFQKILNKQGINFKLNSKVTAVSVVKNKAVVDFTNNKSAKRERIECDKVLVAVGRKANIDEDISKSGIKLDNQKKIQVNEKFETSIKNIFAIGDIVGDPMLAHKAAHEGKVAAEVACGYPAAFDVRAIPSVVYTDPEVAWAGLTETEAKENEVPYEKGEFPWVASGKAIAMGANQGKTKILFDPESKQVLGVGIVGPGAGDMISEGMLAIEMGADAEDIGLTVHPHPTLGETFAMAAEVFEGTITDLYVPKK